MMKIMINIVEEGINVKIKETNEKCVKKNKNFKEIQILRNRKNQSLCSNLAKFAR